MEATRVAHDADVQKELLDDVRRLGHHARIVDGVATERTPLVVKAGTLRVAIDDDVDLEALDAALRQQERDAIDADRRTPAAALWKQEAAGLITLAIPITLALALETLPPILVSMMIGNVAGAAAPQVLAGSSLADFFQGQITTSLVNGLGAAVATLCAQSFGARRPRQLWVYAQAGMLVCLYCLPPLALLCANSASLLALMGQEPPLAHVAGVLIVVSFFSLPFLMVYTVARSALQAQHIAAPFVLASVASYAVSLPLGYYLGYATSLGYVGVALSNIVGNALRAAAVIPILLRHELFRDAWPGWQWREAHALVRSLWPIGGGSVLMTLFQTAGFFSIFVLCGYLPNAAVVMAANNVAAGLLSLSFLPMMGVGAGGITRVGNALGAGQPRRARVASLVVVAEALAVSLVTMVLCWCVADAYGAAFTTDEATVALASELVRYLVVVVPLVGVLYAQQAVFQACGAQWLGAKLNFLFLFALGVPLGLVFAVPLGGGVFGLWNGNIVGVVGLLVTGAVWVARIDWREMAHEARQRAHLHVDREPSPEASLTDSSSQY